MGKTAQAPAAAFSRMVYESCLRKDLLTSNRDGWGRILY